MAPKAKKACPQKGGFELAGPAAAGLLLLAEEVGRRMLKKKAGKKSMRGGAPQVKAAYIVYDDDTVKSCTGPLLEGGSFADAQCEPEPLNAEALKAAIAELEKALAQAQPAATAEPEVQAEDAPKPEEAAASAAAAEEAAAGGGRRCKKKPATKRGGGIGDDITAYFNSKIDGAQAQIQTKLTEKFQQINSAHQAMMPVLGAAAPVVGGAKKKCARKSQKGGDCDHFAAEMPAPAPAPPTFTGGAAKGKKARSQRGGSFGGMLAGAKL